MIKDEIIEAVSNLDEDLVLDLVSQAVADGLTRKEIIRYVILGMNEIGILYESLDYYIADLIMAGCVFKSVLNFFDDLEQTSLSLTATERTGRILIGTVENDIHDIGKSIFTNLALTEGYEVIDLGVDVKPDRFFEEALTTKPDILAMSGIISNAIKSMTETVNLFKKNFIRNDFKIIIGGLSLSE
ncbi:cobalamin-dependent protein [uncultured Acetobacterium sp.]|uniref:cobalamin B12-binding domain-containing protein n=1 Tax=uncultured Acetobacterium sp. TaxID=217139 RepID=UPI0025FAFA06|nr:cobalamin-dependent protein [uncultured Acetobacterium sp.]